MQPLQDSIEEEEEMKVSQIMTQPVITITEDTPLHEVARIMLEHRIGDRQ